MMENISRKEALMQRADTADVSVRGVARDSVLYGFGFLVSRMASFLLLPLYTRVLTPSDYGVLQLLQVSLDIVEIVVAGGLGAGVVRLFHAEPEARRQHEVLTSAHVAILATRVIGSGCILLLAPWLSEALFGTSLYTVHVRLAGANFFVGALSLIPMLQLQASRQTRLYTVISTGRLILQLALSVLFVLVLRWGVLGVLFAAFVSAVLVSIPLLARFHRHAGWLPTWSRIRELWQFGLPYQLSAVAGFILGFGDRYFLNARSTAEVGLYGLAYQFGLLLSSATLEPFIRAYEPVVYQVALLPGTERDRRVNANFLMFNVALLLGGLVLALFAQPVLRIMSAPEFHGAAALVPLIVLAYLIRAWGDFFRMGINVAKDTRYVSYATWLGAVTSLVLYATLIPWIGMWGAAVATVAGFGVRTVAMYVLAQHAWPIAWTIRSSAALVVVAMLAVGVNTAVQATSVAGQLSTASVLLMATVAVAWLGILPVDVREAVRTEASRLVGRLRFRPSVLQ